MEVNVGDIVMIKRLLDINPLEFGCPEREYDISPGGNYYGFTGLMLQGLSKEPQEVISVSGKGRDFRFQIRNDEYKYWCFTLNMVEANLSLECEDVSAEEFKTDIPAILAMI